MKLRIITLTGALTLASVAFAQQPGMSAGPADGPQGGPKGFGMRGPAGPGMGRGLHPAEVVTNAPYSATFVDTRTEKLQDGSVLTHTVTRVVARDTQGRLREEISMEPRGRKGARDKGTEVMVFDPVAQTVTHWNTTTKVAHVMQLPPLGGQRGPGFRGQRPGQGGPEGGPKPVAFERGGHEREGISFASTDLGYKTVDGLSVSGRKVTRTFAAGTMGNEKEIVVSRESWFSPDLKVMISETDSDPFRGNHTLVTKNLSRNEPAATLFKAPEGYTIEQARQPRFAPGQGGPGGRNFGPRRGAPNGQQGPQGQSAPGPQGDNEMEPPVPPAAPVGE